MYVVVLERERVLDVLKPEARGLVVSVAKPNKSNAIDGNVLLARARAIEATSLSEGR